MDQVEVDILKPELAERFATGALNVVVAIVPQFGRDEKFFTADAGCHALL